MKIKLSRNQWSEMGKKAGWIVETQVDQLMPLDGVQNSLGVGKEMKKRRCCMKGCENEFDCDGLDTKENRCPSCRKDKNVI